MLSQKGTTRFALEHENARHAIEKAKEKLAIIFVSLVHQNNLLAPEQVQELKDYCGLLTNGTTHQKQEFLRLLAKIIYALRDPSCNQSQRFTEVLMHLLHVCPGLTLDHVFPLPQRNINTPIHTDYTTSKLSF